jgi:Domain of unknown function (DUF4214)
MVYSSADKPKWIAPERVLGDELERKLKLSAPTSPREVFELLSSLDRTEGLEGLLNRIDWTDVTRSQIKNALLVDANANFQSAGPVRGDPCDYRELAESIIRSPAFQTNVLAFVMQAFPEMARLSFVHIPKCGGTTVNSVLSKKFPWLTEHLANPGWTDQSSFLWALRTIQAQAQNADFLFFSVHQSVPWFIEKGIHRPGDRMFTIVRHPFDIVFSNVNYILKRFQKDPGLTAPDTKEWANKIGLTRFDAAPSSSGLKAMGVEIFDRLVLNQDGVLLRYFGDGSVRSALDNIERSEIEIIPLGKLGQWLSDSWEIMSVPRDNRSDSILSMTDLDKDRRIKLITICEEEIAFYEYITNFATRFPPRTSNTSSITSVYSTSLEELLSTIYRAVLRRDPDQNGLTNYIESMSNGATLQSVLSGFLASKEFRKRFASDPAVRKELNESRPSL